MINKKIFFIILLIIFILFNFTFSVFAGNEGSFINVNYDYLYNYQFLDYEDLQNSSVSLFSSNYQTFKEKCIAVTQTDEVRSGDWYYFAGFYTEPFVLLVKRSLIENSQPYFLIQNWKELGCQHFRLVFPGTTSPNNHPEEHTNEYKLYFGNTYFGGDDSSMSSTFVADFSSSAETFYMPFVTNFDGNVLIKFHNNTSKILKYAQPYIANTTEQLQNLNASMCAVLFDVPSSVSYLSLHNSDDNSTLFNIHLSDYSDYVQRIDLSDPFSNLGYVIPWDKVNSTYSIFKNSNYELRLTYTIDNNTVNVSKFWTSLVDFSTTGGGGTPSEPSTPDYTGALNNIDTSINNSANQISDSISDSTDRILDDNIDSSEMNIDTGVVDGVDDSSVYDFLFKFADIFTNALKVDDTVSTVSFPIRDSEIVFRSDILSSQLNKPEFSFLKTLIQGAWILLFGLYIWRFSFNVINHIKDGSILEGNIGADEVISDTLL